MVLIYHFESNETFGPAASALLQSAEDGRCRLVVSVLVRLEVLVVPKRHGRDDLCRRYRDFLESFPNLEVRPMDAAVAEAASDLRASRNLRTPDAIHLATSLRGGADAFVTQDDHHFPAGVDGIPILTIRAALARIRPIAG